MTRRLFGNDIITICWITLKKLKEKNGIDIIDLTMKIIIDNQHLYTRTYKSYEIENNNFVGLPTVYFNGDIEFIRKDKIFKISSDGEIYNEYIPLSYTRCKNLGHDEFYCPTCVNRFIQNTQKLFNNVLINPMICHDEFEKIVDGCKA